ncbi:MAG: hypothetical protein IPM95_15710 [Sphingobacteriales bacterium]|jgi:hypothetical protein|nr:hypothetical protein [Sphingobacteriales bacterium]
MKKRIAREILYLLGFSLIVGLFCISIVTYNKKNSNKLNKTQAELQKNYSFLQEKNIEFVCFNNGKFDYTIPIYILGDFTTNRSDLKLIGKITDNIPIVSSRNEIEDNASKEVDALELLNQLNKKLTEKLSAEESEQINAYIANTKLYGRYSNRILTENDVYYNIKIVALTLLIVLFIIRYLYYTVSWSLKTLKE